MSRDPLEGDEWIDPTNGNRYIFDGAVWRQAPCCAGDFARNFIGLTGATGVDGSNSTLPGMSRIPRRGDEWVDPINGNRYIFDGTVWNQAPCCVVNYVGTGSDGNTEGSTGSLTGMTRAPREGDQWADIDTGSIYIFQGGIWNLVPSHQANFIGTTGASGSSGSTGPLPGMIRDPVPGDEWKDPISGDTYIFQGGVWLQVPCCGAGGTTITVNGTSGPTGPILSSVTIPITGTINLWSNVANIMVTQGSANIVIEPPGNFIGITGGISPGGTTGPLSGMPRDPINGDQWFDPDNGASYIYNGGWFAVPASGGAGPTGCFNTVQVEQIEACSGCFEMISPYISTQTVVFDSQGDTGTVCAGSGPGTRFYWNPSNSSVVQGTIIDGSSSISGSGSGNRVAGQASNTGTLTSNGIGTEVFGKADTNSLIGSSLAGRGAQYSGYAYNNSQIYSTGSVGQGYIITGSANNNSDIESITGIGCIGAGYANNTSLIRTQSEGSHALGRAENNSQIRINTSGAYGSIVSGYADFTSTIYTNLVGAVSTGYAENNSNIYNLPSGVISAGYARDSSNIYYTSTTAYGSNASGYADDNSNIYIEAGPGNIAKGYALNNSAIRTTNAGNRVGGQASNTGTLRASGIGTEVFGKADTNSLIGSSLAGRGAQYSGYAYNNSQIYSTGSVGQGYIITGSANNNSDIESITGIGCIGAGYANNTSLIRTQSEGSHALGRAENNSQIRINTSGAYGSIVSGYADFTSTIYTNLVGAVSTGYAENNSNIYNLPSGVISAGYARDSSNIYYTSTTAYGSNASGYADDNSNIYIEAGPGNIAKGYALNNSAIRTTNAGNRVGGQASNTGTLRARGYGDEVFGKADTNSFIGSSVVGRGAQYSGYAYNNSQIDTTSAAAGTIITGFASNTSIIRSNGIGGGSLVAGYANDNSQILARTYGCLSMGYVDGTETINASANATIAHGRSVNSTGIGAITMGSYLSNSRTDTVLLGQYGFARATDQVELARGTVGVSLGAGNDGIGIILRIATANNNPTNGQGIADYWSAGGADYAEYFEWADGNPANEDRRGLFVTLNKDKIEIAPNTSDVIGVISGNPSVTGDSADLSWHKTTVRDEYGTPVTRDSYAEPMINYLISNSIHTDDIISQISSNPDDISIISLVTGLVDQELTSLSSKLDDIFNAIRSRIDEFDNNHQVELNTLDTDHQAALDTLDTDHQAALNTLDTDHQAALNILDTDHQAALDTLDTDHQAALDTLDTDHTVELDQRQQDQDQELIPLTNKYNSDLRKLDPSETEAIEELTRIYNQERSDILNKYDIDGLVSKYNTNRESLVSNYNDNRESLVSNHNDNRERLVSKYNTNRDRLVSDYNDNRDRLVSDYNDNLDRLVSRYTSARESLIQSELDSSLLTLLFIIPDTKKEIKSRLDVSDLTASQSTCLTEVTNAYNLLKIALSEITPMKLNETNPNFDPNVPYIPRSQRKEWSPVGLMGKLYVKDNGQCVVGERCDCVNGIAVPGTKWLVSKRSSPNVIRITL